MNPSIRPSDIAVRTLKKHGRCIGAIATHTPTGLKAYAIGRYKHSCSNMAVNHLLAEFSRRQSIKSNQQR